MSLLPPEVNSALSQLLVSLQSADNVERTRAEETLNNDWLASRPEVLLVWLTEGIQSYNAVEAEVRRARKSAEEFLGISYRMHPLLREAAQVMESSYRDVAITHPHLSAVPSSPSTSYTFGFT